jgi:N-acetylmuramic acid 6-phosphate etherase
MRDRSKLTTEKRNPRTRDIDRRSTLRIVDLINAEDRRVAGAVGRERRNIARAVDLIAGSFRAGGRLFYVGAGTSGRLGVLDASECPPTFGVKPGMVQGIIAGGRRALVRSSEGAEDDTNAGAVAVVKRRVRAGDTVVGIAACGLTPYVKGALDRAKRIGAKTVFVTFSPEARGAIQADVIINPVTGPEALTGSTRMKAGTATKLVLNTLSTAAMIRVGKAYGNLMVDLRARSFKLCDRAERIIMTLTGVSSARARRLLALAHGEAKTAIVMQMRGCDYVEARRLLRNVRGLLRDALAVTPRGDA